MGTLVLLTWLYADTAPQPAPPTQTPEDAELERELEKALAADKAEAAKANPPQPTATPTTNSASLLNPAMAVIGTFSGAWRRDPDVPPSFVAGDDPAPTGLTAQEIELAFTSDVDPYFKMRLFLTIPQLEGIEVEEAYLLTTDLPRNFQVKAGVLRSQFGRNNEQHLHLQDFARRPYMTFLLGDDGLKPPGIQGSVLLPLPWYTTLYAEVLTLAPGGEAADQLSFTAVLEQFFELSDCWSLLVGLNFAALDRGPDEEADPPGPDPDREYLGGADVYLKWKPTSVAQSWAWVAFTAEYAARRSSDGGDLDGAGYAQIVAQVARRWRVGLRGDVVGLPHHQLLPREYVVSGSIAFLPTEYSRLRLTASHEHNADDSDLRNQAVFLQLEAAIGAHGAHPF